MSSATTSSSSGIGLGGLLFLLFVGLKLTHVIAWSWWWVTSPLWISFLLFFGALGLGAALLALAKRLERKPARRF